MKDHTVTQQVYDQRAQAKNVAEATVKAQEAAVAAAELDYQFTDLKAPISGRIGDRRVSVGNLVIGGITGTPTLLATVVSVDPIRFEFTFDEAAYLRYERLAHEGKDVTSREGSVIVGVKLLDENDFVHQGRLDFVDNVIDKSSGTIRGRAVFSNPDGVLTPGMFGRIRVPGSPPYQAMLVPEVAIGTEQARKFLLVVGADGTVQQKFPTFGQAVGQMRVVKDGLTPDDRVIVNGLMRARPGQKVTPQDEDAPQVGPGRPQADAGTTKSD